MSEWKPYKLEHVIDSANTGLDAIQRAPIVQEDTGIRCLRIQDISQNKDFENWGFTKVREDNFQRFQLHEGDLIIARTGETVGVNKYIDKTYQSVYNNGLIRIRFNKDIIFPKFGYYQFQTDRYKGHINGAARGTSTQPNMKIQALLDFEFSIPEMDEQKEIASILSSLDDKIELNLQMNQTLEAMAQAIFKEWFVNFNFPGFDGELVDGLPKGWKMGKMNEIAKIEIGRTPPRAEEEWFSTDPKDIKWISIKDLGLSGVYIFNTSEYLTQEAVEKFRIPVIPENTVVLSFKLTIGRLAITTETMLSNEAIAQIKSDSFSPEYIYTYLKTYNWGTLGSTSSIATAINSKIIKEMEVLIPDGKVEKQFQEVVKPIFEKLKSNSQEIETLTQIRDSLLPKLMTGKIQIQA